MSEVKLVSEVVEFYSVIDVSTLSCCIHPTPYYMPCMRKGLNVSKFHAGHDVVWNLYVRGNMDIRKLAMRINLFLSWEQLLLL
jgi:hypothetical protein